MHNIAYENYANTTVYVSMHFIFILCRTYEKEDADLCAHYVFQHLQYSRMHACTHTHTNTRTHNVQQKNQLEKFTETWKEKKHYTINYQNQKQLKT